MNHLHVFMNVVVEQTNNGEMNVRPIDLTQKINKTFQNILCHKQIVTKTASWFINSIHCQ